MTGQRILRNRLGQVIEIGSVIVYSKTVRTLTTEPTPGVVVDIDDKQKDSVLIVETPASVRRVRLSKISKVIVVDLNSLNLPTDEDRIIRSSLASLVKGTV